MAVTTANTIKFSDVCLEIYGSANTSGKSLLGVHTAATGTFNGSYATLGTIKTLLDFRGYIHVALDTQAPSVPTNFRRTGGTGNYHIIAWDASTDNIAVAGYEIMVSGEENDPSNDSLYGVYASVSSSTLTYSIDFGAYFDYVKVRSYDAAGNRSALTSNYIGNGTPVYDSTIPSDTGTLSIGAITSTSIALSWVAATDNVGIAGYKIYNSAGTLLHTTTGTGLSYIFTGLASSTAYSYKIKAYDTAGNISANYSNTVTPSTTAPASTTPPTLNSVTLGYVYLAVAFTSVSGATSYEIHRSVSGGAYSLVRTQANNTTWSDTDLVEYTNYCYKVRAYKDGSWSAFSNIICTTTDGDW